MAPDDKQGTEGGATPALDALCPTFSLAAVSSVFASIVRGALAAGEEIGGQDLEHTQTPQSLRLALCRAIDKDLDHWENHISTGTPSRVKKEFQVLRALFLKTLEHQMSFAPSRDQPN